MAQLSLVGWINGLSASGLVVFGIIFGSYVLYKGKRADAKLLIVLGFTFIFASLGWLGNLVDFITILTTGSNMANPYGIYIILSNMWLPLTILTAMYVGAELIISEKTKLIVVIFIVLGSIYEFFLFLDPLGSYNFVYPSPSGINLIDEIMILFSPLGIITAVYVLSVAIFLGVGFLVKAIQSSGKIRINFLIIWIGILLYVGFATLDALGGSFPAIVLVFFRMGVLFSLLMMYFGYFRYIGI
ncbi:MAG: hypothetical protein GF383_03285 [Candidatus Lokiarchaeota archaeon]|nr:hypothetical protein [Candidatus Lokiarchaeota archaeon]MBD3338640.1 hypothetical protein [Candidatus Lokiarchaeota archaeon]